MSASCPRCGFSYGWTGSACFHCHHRAGADRRVRVVVNGKAESAAGKKKSAYERVRKALRDAASRHRRLDVALTRGARHAEDLARAAAEQGFDTVVAVGGDGTLHEVVNGVAAGRGAGGSTPPVAVGVIPLGTANDFASAFGIGADDPDSALRVILDGRPTLVDVPAVNGRHFINMATGGLMTAATVDLPNGLKDDLGDFAYLLNGLKRLGATPPRARFTEEGLDWEGSFDILALGNGRQAGGGWKLCRHARPDDGLLDLLIVPSDFHLGRFLKACFTLPFRAIRKGLRVGKRLADGLSLFEHGVLGDALDLGKDLFIERRVSAVTIRSDGEVQLNLDGEPLRGCTFEVTTGVRIPFYLPAAPPS